MAEETTTFAQAVALHQAGDLSSAENLYRQLLNAGNDAPEIAYALGTLLLQQGRFDQSIEILEAVANRNPDLPEIQNNLGVAYKAAGDWRHALQAFETALKQNPDYGEAFFNLGKLMEERGLSSDAEKCYRRAVAIEPNDFQSRMGLIRVLIAQSAWNEAEESLRIVCDQAPESLDVLVQLGFVFVKQEKLDEASEIYEKILTSKPEFIEIRNNLSFVCERLGKLEEAAQHAQQAIKTAPGFAEGFNNLGIALRSQHRLEESKQAFEQAVRIRGDFALARFNLATTRLLEGDFKQGWPDYEKRLETSEHQPRQFSQPQWDGNALDAGPLLIYADQGFGDAIQFCRFLPEARQRSQTEIIFQCQPAVLPLFRDQLQIDRLINEDDASPECTAQIPLGSLAPLFDKSIDEVADTVPYLKAPTTLPEQIQAVIQQADHARLKVGIVWRGNPEQARDVLRSCPLAEFRALTGIPEVTFFSLQVGEDVAAELKNTELGFPLIEMGSLLQDFAQTASAMSQLDLMLTVDTASAHLAGALGLPVWTILCHTPDWRWLLDRPDSPWYPSMRLFRQPQWGDWGAVMQVVARELQKWVAAEQ